MSDQQAARSSDDPFDDLLAANERYRSTAAHDATIEGRAGRGLAVLTCMDTRLDPLAVLGLAVGDAKIVRNAGARPTDDALRSLVLATNLLGVTRIALIGHTRCAMFSSSEAELRELISTRTGRDASGWEFLAGSRPGRHHSRRPRRDQDLPTDPGGHRGRRVPLRCRHRRAHSCRWMTDRWVTA